jgi:hypothetical protein
MTQQYEQYPSWTPEEQDAAAYGRALATLKDGKWTRNEDDSITVESVARNRVTGKFEPVTYTVDADGCHECMRARDIKQAEEIAAELHTTSPLAKRCLHVYMRMHVLGLDEALGKMFFAKYTKIVIEQSGKRSEALLMRAEIAAERAAQAPLSVTLENTSFAAPAAPESTRQDKAIIEIYDPKGQKAQTVQEDGRVVVLPRGLLLRIPEGVQPTVAGAAAVAYFARKGQIVSWKSGSVDISTISGQAFYNNLQVVPLS